MSIAFNIPPLCSDQLALLAEGRCLLLWNNQPAQAVQANAMITLDGLPLWVEAQEVVTLHFRTMQRLTVRQLLPPQPLFNRRYHTISSNGLDSNRLDSNRVDSNRVDSNRELQP